MASTKGRLRLFFLPPYSPELNPDEQVWAEVKAKGIGRRVITSASQMFSMLPGLLRPCSVRRRRSGLSSSIPKPVTQLPQHDGLLVRRLVQ